MTPRVGARPGPFGPVTLRLYGFVLLACILPQVLWRTARRRLRGLWARVRLLPPIALAGFALALSAPLAGCGGPSAAGAETPAQRAPAAVVAYDLAVEALTWLDGQNAGQHAAMSRQMVALLNEQDADFVAQCGPENAGHCKLSAYEDLMSEWRSSSGYDERTARLERAREALSLFADVLERPSSEADIRTAVRNVVDALSVIVGELESLKVEVPPEVHTALAVLRRL